MCISNTVAKVLYCFCNFHLLLGLLTVDPHLRLTISQLIAHPWLSPDQSVSDAPLATPTTLSSAGSTEVHVPVIRIVFLAFP